MAPHSTSPFREPSMSEHVDILLVEDSPSDAELAMRALKTGNPAVKITHVEDGEAALDILFGDASAPVGAPFRPKLIILDLKMPKVNGLDVLQRIKSESSTKIIPVIMLTSSMEERDVAEAYRLGVNSYIVKPVNYDEYKRTVVLLVTYWMNVNHVFWK